MNKRSNVSSSVIKRLPRYYRFLTSLDSSGIEKISSGNLAKQMHLTASQIRQDLNCFGGFGQQGYGYNIKNLSSEIAEILNLNIKKNIIIIGAGSLGKTIASQIDFNNCGFNLVGILDTNYDLIGKEIAGITVSSMGSVETLCHTNQIDSVVLCIPKTAAEKVAPHLIKYGIKNFWNFSHYDLQLDFENVVVENMHLSDSLMRLSYHSID